MAATKQPSIFLFLAFLTLASIIISSNADDCVSSGTMAVYWGGGTESDEGTLEEVCATGYYNTVILQLLEVHNSGSFFLKLGYHCGTPDLPPCSKLQTQIEYCQRNNIKVLLSVAQDKERSLTRGLYNRSAASLSGDVTKELADYLLKNYLSGQPGPLGSVYLDGIDIFAASKIIFLKWDELVKTLIASTTDRRIYISAFPQCVYPDEELHDAIKTGLVDYIWVDFTYEENCKYSNATTFSIAWKNWTSSVPNSLIFLGLNPYDNRFYNYIPPDVVKSEVLPIAKQASNYGGVMIWDFIYDKSNSYTTQIKDSVPKICNCTVCDEPASTGFYGIRTGTMPIVGSI